MRPAGQHVLTIGPFRLDRRNRTLMRDGVTMVLGGRALDVLLVLAEAEGRTVPKADLLELAWPGVIVEENNLQVQISILRKALGDGWIVTVPGVGYRLTGTTSAHARAAGKPSIAVLPFANLSGTARRQFIADGIAEEIVTTLSRLGALFVISRNSSFTYKDRPVEVQKVAQDLSVRYVLEGAVRFDNTHIRVTAGLIDVEAGGHIWAGRYDRNIGTILSVQDEISQAVVAALGPLISEAERKRAMSRPPDNLDAWEAYQRALWHWSRQGADSHANARHWLEKAVTLDACFVQAHACLAYLHLSDFTRGLHRQPHESLHLAETEARRAIALDPDSPSGHATLVWIFTHRGRMRLAREKADLAAALGPSDAWAHVSLGHVLVFSGEAAQAPDALATALRLDPYGPTAPIALHHLGLSYYFQRDYGAAEAAARRTISSFPNFPRPYPVLAASLGQLDRHDEAEDALAAANAVASHYVSSLTSGRMAYYSADDFEHLLEGLRKAGWRSE